MARTPQNIIGERFGRLIITSEICRPPGKDRIRRFIAMCDCGGTKTGVRLDVLRRGDAKSCGCFKKECARKVLIGNEYHLEHGDARNGKRAPEHQTWTAMLDRCKNSNNQDWMYYGGRGVRVCRRWHNYENFILDMGRKPSPKHSIDRINPYGNYEPENCRWATAKEQANNQRRHIGGLHL